MTSCSHSQGVTQRARENVEHHRERKAEAQDSAQHHQHELEPVERPPLQVTLPLQHQFVGDGHVPDSPSFPIVVPANAGTHNPRR